MKKSISFRLVLLALKAKGLKKIFSQNPIDYIKLRKEDVKEPKGRFYAKRIRRRFTVLATTVTEIASPTPSGRLVIYVPGGAFVSGPGQQHWAAVKKIQTETNHTVWLCDYPKAPETKIKAISKNIDEVYTTAIEEYKPGAITLVGDSVGGTLIIGLVQRIIQGKRAAPEKIILVSPVLDASLPNPKSLEIDKTDPMLSAAGFLSAKSMCAENNNLKSPQLSPVYGNFRGFPRTILYLAENDITYPDQLEMVDKLTRNKVDLVVVTGEGMPHIWPLLPFMTEAAIALEDIIGRLRIRAK